MDKYEWQVLLLERNAYRKGIFYSRRARREATELGSTPTGSSQTEKMCWHMGVQEGLGDC